MDPGSAAQRFALRCARDTANPMLNFLARRIVQLIPTLFFVSILIFSLQQLLRAAPDLVRGGGGRAPAVIEQIRKQSHLDQPIPVQYVYWVKGVLSGEFGGGRRGRATDAAAPAPTDYCG